MKKIGFKDVFTKTTEMNIIVNTSYNRKMKKAFNVRLSPGTYDTLAVLSENLKKTKTEIIEEAISSYSRNKIKNPDIFKFMGIWTEEEADRVEKFIKENRRSKPMKKYEL